MKHQLVAVGALAMLMASGCASAFWFAGWRSLAIQRVNLGDVRSDVIRRLGNPDQIMSKTLLADGRTKEVWLYEALRRPSSAWSRDEKPELPERVVDEQQYQLDRLHNPSYLVTLIDGKVVEISRQR